MANYQNKLPWGLMVLFGIALIGVSIFLLADLITGLVLLTWLVALGAAFFGIYNLYQALKTRDDNERSIPLLIHGLLDIVLVLLIIVIPDSQALLGVILACWLIVFGVFEVIPAKKSNTGKRRQLGVILVIAGLAALVIPLILSFNYIILIAIAGIVYGIVCIIQGITRSKEDSGEARSRLL